MFKKDRIELEDKPIPDIGPNDALIRMTTTTICGTDVHILKGEYPVAQGLTIGHQIGDTVVKFAQGSIGLCATAGAKLKGATTILAVDTVPERLAIARQMGADHVIDFSKVDPVTEVMKITDGRGVDVAIEALVTHRYKLDDIVSAYELFSNQRDGVLKVAITP